MAKAKPTALKWISARHLKHFIAQAESAGANMQDLLDEAGIMRERLADADYPVPVSAVELMLAAAMRERDDPLLGLRLARNIQPAALGPLGFLTQSCSSFSDVLDIITRYSGLLSNIGRTSVIRHPGEVEVRWDCLAGGRLFRQQATEYVLGILVVTARLLLPGHTDLPLAVNFMHKRPSTPEHARQYISFFECPVYFDKPESSLILSNQILQAKLSHSDAFMKEMLERHAANILKQRTIVSSLHDEVRHLIRALMIEGTPGKEVVATQLGMSERSLHRRLNNSGSSYRELLDEVRLEIATEQLKSSSESTLQISERLGFSTRQAFLRWYKQQTGRTPGEYRNTTNPRNKS